MKIADLHDHNASQQLGTQKRIKTFLAANELFNILHYNYLNSLDTAYFGDLDLSKTYYINHEGIQ